MSGPEEPAAAPRRRWALLRRLPILLVIAAGLWMWKGGGGRFFPQTRELVWLLPEDRSRIRSVEIQLWDQGALLKREELFYPAGPPSPEITQKLPLQEGDFQARVF